MRYKVVIIASEYVTRYSFLIITKIDVKNKTLNAKLIHYTDE